MPWNDDRQPSPWQARPLDAALLFALRLMLSSAVVGMAVAWLNTLPAFSWGIWKFLLYFGVTGLLSGLIFGRRNYGWLRRIRETSLRGQLALVIHYCLMANGVVAVLIALTSSQRLTKLICGVSLAVMAVCSWAIVRWVDRSEGGRPSH